MGGFDKIPRARRNRTMNGAAANVILILIGANSLWIEYATTNVPAPDVTLFVNEEPSLL